MKGPIVNYSDPQATGDLDPQDLAVPAADDPTPDEVSQDSADYVLAADGATPADDDEPDPLADQDNADTMEGDPYGVVTP